MQFGYSIIEINSFVCQPLVSSNIALLQEIVYRVGFDTNTTVSLVRIIIVFLNN